MKMLLSSLRDSGLRNKILVVIMLIILFRLGSLIPIPGVNLQNIKTCTDSIDKGSLLGTVNLFSGGALLKLSIFALGVMPYITASIIMQLLTVVIPKLENLKKEGQSGQTKITQYTRYLTLGLAGLQGAGVLALARSGNLIQGCQLPILREQNNNVLFMLMLLTMICGVSMVMWIGELITKHGIGNGMSILIMTSVISAFPSGMWLVQTTRGWPTFLALLAGIIFLIAVVVFLERAQRRIPIQYAKRQVGSKIMGGGSTFIPLKVNQAGVVPVIFASSMLLMPTVIAQFNSSSKNTFIVFINDYLVRGTHPLYMTLYFLLVVFFTFFYVSITFNPKEISENLAQSGGFVPNIRPGKPTESYLAYISHRLTSAGSLYLGLLALIPLVAFSVVGASQSLPLGGTSLLIMAGVALDTVKSIEGQMQQDNYKGFLK